MAYVLGANQLQQVVTFNEGGLAAFSNTNALLEVAEKRFENFETVTGQLGSTVNIKLPGKATTANGLIVSPQSYTQRRQALTVDQSANTCLETTDPELIFNLDEKQFMEEWGKGAIASHGSTVEYNLGLNITGKVPVMITNPAKRNEWIESGNYHTESGPFKFFGDGITALTSYQQLVQMVQNWNATGQTYQEKTVILPNTIVPAIIGTSHGQFTPKRNDETANSWELGNYGSPNVRYLTSNLLPIHTAGLIGNGATLPVKQLVVVSTNDPTGQNITQITCTCDSSLSGLTGVIKMGDLGQFVDANNVTPLSEALRVRQVTTVGHHPTRQPVQFRCTADADASGTTVVLSVLAGNGYSGPLGIVSAKNSDQYITKNIVAGMVIQILPSHQCGLMIDGKALFMGMPKMPNQNPFSSSSMIDKDTGTALRMTYGHLLGQNEMLFYYDNMWGSTLIPENSCRIILPL